MRHLLGTTAFLAAILTAGGCGGGDKAPTGVEDDGSPPSDGAVAAFADSSLEAAVRAALEKPEGELSEEDLLSVTELVAQGREIVDLTGIERLLNLSAFGLADNRTEMANWTSS